MARHPAAPVLDPSTAIPILGSSLLTVAAGSRSYNVVLTVAAGSRSYNVVLTVAAGSRSYNVVLTVAAESSSHETSAPTPGTGDYGCGVTPA